MIQRVTKSLIFKRMGHIREEMKADSMQIIYSSNHGCIEIVSK